MKDEKKKKENPFFSLLKEISLWNLLKAKNNLLPRDNILMLLFFLLPCTFCDLPISQLCWDRQWFLRHFNSCFCRLGEEQIWGLVLLVFSLHSVFEAKLWTNDFYSLDVGALKIWRSSPPFSPSFFFPLHQQMFLKKHIISIVLRWSS